MPLIEAVSEAVTAKQAAEMFGLKFDRQGNKAICPWHNDRHPSLSFKGRRCKCFACNNGGDAVDITAQILGVTLMDAAKQLSRAFGINAPVDIVDFEQIRARREAAEKAKVAKVMNYSDLCDIERLCGEALRGYIGGMIRGEIDESPWDNQAFVRTLKLYAEAQDLLNGWRELYDAKPDK